MTESEIADRDLRELDLTPGQVRVYLAARYSRQAELRGYAAQLRERGYHVTSSWLDIDEGADPVARANENRKTCEVPETARAYARQDRDDIETSDLLILFAEPAGSYGSRGGRLVELGMAIGLQLEVHVVGRAETVFHRLPEVRLHGSWEACLEALGPPGESAA